MQKRFLHIGLIWILMSSFASAQGIEPSCSNMLGDFSQFSSLPSIDRMVSQKFTDHPHGPLKGWEKTLGFQPHLRYSIQLYDEALTLLYPGSNRVFARMAFSFENHKLMIDSMAVAKDFRNRGLTSYLFGQILALNKPFNEIETFLAQDNLAIFHQALKEYQRLSLSKDELCHKAIQQTPAYRIYKNFGYGQIIACNDRKMNLTQPTSIDLHIGFTVRKD